jgi:hypothetical protein
MVVNGGLLFQGVIEGLVLLTLLLVVPLGLAGAGSLPLL